ncbi:MAG: hypothetical protein HY731_01300 [Candidatus Tectomicrobia bacterium]|nr:hypothetical protein [Candidatus Tectomicrobia bacterium]
MRLHLCCFTWVFWSLLMRLHEHLFLLFILAFTILSSSDPAFALGSRPSPQPTERVERVVDKLDTT